MAFWYPWLSWKNSEMILYFKIEYSTYTRQVWTAVFDARPTLRACMAQGLFLGGTGRRAVAHTRPEFVKNTLGPFGIPLVRGASGAGQWTQPSRRPKEISRYRDTLGQIRAADNTAGRSATRHLERFRSRLICPDKFELRLNFSIHLKISWKRE